MYIFFFLYFENGLVIIWDLRESLSVRLSFVLISYFVLFLSLITKCKANVDVSEKSLRRHQRLVLYGYAMFI